MLSGYRIMWLCVMFDLPTDTQSDRKAASGFRKNLLNMGFEMAQFSVYIKFCANSESIATHIKKIESFLPAGGQISILQFTDKQYERIINYKGGKKAAVKNAPDPFDLY
jgi:CRISPR-associated protein Cas2